MSYTAPASFDKFIENISVSDNQSEAANSRYQSIVDLLNTEFSILEGFPLGSLVNGNRRNRYYIPTLIKKSSTLHVSYIPLIQVK